MMQELINSLVAAAGSWGYVGIFVLMFLESTFFPFPSEVVMIPAGYLAYRGEINLYISIIVGIIGSYLGAVFNYFLARKYGRKFLIKYGKYLFIKEKTLEKLEIFFKKYGSISTFNGRLIPGVRQYISLPAGLAKMSFIKFSIYTVAGAGIWVTLLALIGFFIGGNEALIRKYLNTITAVIFIAIAIITFIYYIKRRSR